MARDRRVVVTGIGLVTAVGIGEDAVWASLLAGRGGVARIQSFDATANHIAHGAEVDVAALNACQDARMHKADRSLRFALEASRQALAQAGRLPQDAGGPQAVASLWGSGAGPTESLEFAHDRYVAKGPAGMKPSTVPKCMANMTAAGVSIHFQLTGTNQVIVAACTSSTNAVGVGMRMIRHGYADAVLCGGVDTPITPFYFSLWNNLGVFSQNAEPGRAVRPFDLSRDGTLLGEGAGAVLLESLESATRRSVRPRGEILGYGESSDATHITAPSSAGQAVAIRRALDDAGVTAEEVGYINAHGTGTRANDTAESAAIHEAFGAVSSGIPVGAMKSFLGHTLGASGIIELAASIMALERGIAPPNLNLDQPDPACGLALIGEEARPLSSGIAIKNSFGFGGGNAVLVLRQLKS